MDPFELLKKDHQRVSKLFEQIESASRDAKMRMFRQLKQELDVHAHIEETIFYPALEREKQTREITLEAYEEHRVVKDLLAQLDAASSADDGWEARLSVLKENVEHHVEEEEGELFDKANDVLTGGQADELGDQMQAEKARQSGGYAPDQRRRAKAAATNGEPTKGGGIIGRVVRAVGAGISAARASQSSGTKKRAKATKKAAPKKSTARKAAKKTAGKTAKKATAKRPSASKAARKGTTKRSTKSTSTKASKRSTKR